MARQSENLEGDIAPEDLEQLRAPEDVPPLIALLRWVPVFAGLGILAQIGIRGVKPALAENRALQEKARLLDEREAATEERRVDTSDRLDAQDDPIYQERLRRRRLEEMERALKAQGVDPRVDMPRDPPESSGSAADDT